MALKHLQTCLRHSGLPGAVQRAIKEDARERLRMTSVSEKEAARLAAGKFADLVTRDLAAVEAALGDKRPAKTRNTPPLAELEKTDV